MLSANILRYLPAAVIDYPPFIVLLLILNIRSQLYQQMKKLGYSKSIDRLLTHSPSGVFLKKKYLESCDEPRQQLPQNESLFDMHSENMTTLLRKEKASRYPLKQDTTTVNAIRSKEKIAVSRSQSHMNRLLAEVKQVKNQFPALNSKNQNILLEQLQKIQTKETAKRDLSYKENLTKWVADFKQKSKRLRRLRKKSSRSPTSESNLTGSSILKHAPKISRAWKYRKLFSNQESQATNNLKPTQIAISSFVSKFMNRTKDYQPFSKSKIRLKTQHTSDRSEVEADNNLNDFLRSKLEQISIKHTQSSLQMPKLDTNN